MGQTITEKIFSEHVGREVLAGEIVRSPIDMVIGNDITTPISIKAFEDGGFDKLANPEGFAIVLDHFIPAKDIASANQAKISREFAYKHDLKYFFDEKDMGIEHALLPEKGLVLPGDVIIGADSHTCTHGALGAFSTGMGSTDISFGMITGGNWFKVPESIKIVFNGKPSEFVTGKDLILEIIRILGVDGALYKTLEFTGDTIQYLTMDDRFSLCNMAIEAGAKNGIVAYDEITQEFLDTRDSLRAEPKIHYSDEDAVYCQEIVIDVEKLEPVIAYPFLPSNGHSISQAVADEIRALGANIIAMTPESVSHVKETKQKNGVTFDVFSDEGSHFAKELGLVFTLPKSLQEIYLKFDIDVEKHNGESKFELPIPTTLIIKPNREIVYIYADGDYTKRSEPDTLLDILKTI